MSGQVNTGLSVKDLETFRDDHGTSRHTCRLRSCPHATLGFKSEELRIEHESSHVRKNLFPCIDPSCYYPPFLTAQALKAHTKKYHGAPIPRTTIRRPSSRNSTPRSRISPPIKQLPRNTSSVPEQALEETVSLLDILRNRETQRLADQSELRPWLQKTDSSWVEKLTQGPHFGDFENDYDGTPSQLFSTLATSAVSKKPESRASALSFLLNDDPAPSPPAAPKKANEAPGGMKRSNEPTYRLPDQVIQRDESKAFSSSVASIYQNEETEGVAWDDFFPLQSVSQDWEADLARWAEPPSQTFRASQSNFLHPAGHSIDSEPRQVSSNPHYPSFGNIDWQIEPPDRGSFTCIFSRCYTS